MTDQSTGGDWKGSWHKSAELKELEKRGFDVSSAEQWMLAFDKSYFAQDKTVVSLLATVANNDTRASLYAETQEFLKNGYYNRNISHNLLLKWWKHCVENKDLELCRYLLEIFPADATFREDIHYGVYKFQYPITLILQSSWQEGFKLLTETNVNLGKYRARSSKPCETFYDVERMADQNGVILTQNLRGKIKRERSSIDPLRLRTDNQVPPESITNQLMG